LVLKGFYKTRNPDVIALCDELIGIRRWLCRLENRHPCCFSCTQRSNLITGLFQHICWRAHEGQPVRFSLPGQICVFGEEAIARINCVNARFQSNIYDAVHIQIRPHWMAFVANPVRFISFLPVNRVTVLIREDRYGLCTEFVTRAECTDSDLASVGNQNFLKHSFPTVAFGRVSLSISQGTSMILVLSRLATDAQVCPTISFVYTLNTCDTTHVEGLCKNYVRHRDEHRKQPIHLLECVIDQIFYFITKVQS